MDGTFNSFEPAAALTASMRLALGQGHMLCGDRVWCHALAWSLGEIAHVFYPDGSRSAPSDVGAPLLVFRSGGTCLTDVGAGRGFSDLIFYPDGRRPSSAYYGGVHEFQILALRPPDPSMPGTPLPATHIEKVWQLILRLRHEGHADAADRVFRDIIEGARGIVGRRISEVARQAARLLHGNGVGPTRSAEVAVELGVSEAHLCRQFRRAFGTSISRYVRLTRLNCAAGLLWGTSLPISTVAIMCGFSDQSHLTRELDALFAETPHAFRRLAPCLGNPRLSASVHPLAPSLDVKPAGGAARMRRE